MCDPAWLVPGLPDTHTRTHAPSTQIHRTSLHSRSSRFGPRYGIAVSLLCGVVFHVALQEVAAAAENKRIFSPLSGPLVAPQGEASSEEWALDVVAKGNAVVVCLVQVLQARFEADGLAGFREFQVGDASTGRQ